jgi:hypothetical protein
MLKSLNFKIPYFDYRESSLLLTLLIPIFFFSYLGGEIWMRPLQFMAVVGILVSQIKNNRYYIPVYFVFFIIYMSTIWMSADNHKWVFGLLVLNFLVNKSIEDDEFKLKQNFRFVLGIVFGVATFWKIYYGMYLNGSFFEFTFASDTRFQLLAEMFTDLSFEDIRLNSIITTTYFSEGGQLYSYKTPYTITENTKMAALVMSYYTLIIEGFIALMFILKGLGKIKNNLADYILIFFILTTYVFVPVLGFANVLIAMGLGQCENNRVGWLYLFCIVCLQVSFYL